MLAPVLLASASVAGQAQFLRDIPPGMFEAFYLHLSGDAAAGESLVPSEFGRVRLHQEGRPIVNVDFDNLRTINNLQMGLAIDTATAGGANELGVVIPRGFLDGNVQRIIEADNVQVEIEYGATFTTVFTSSDSATQKVYGLVRETGQMAYNLQIHQQDHTYGSGVFELPIRTENVCAIYVVKGTAGDLDRVRAVKDGREFCNIATVDFQELSDIVNRHEQTTASGMMEIAIAEPGAITDMLSDDVVLEFTTSPAAPYTQETIVFSADFDPVKLRLTKQESAAVLQRKLARKNTLGRGRPVQAVNEGR